MALLHTTLTILRNFAKINPGIVLFPGNELRTMSAFKNIYAKATLQQTIPEQIAIKDLKQFLKLYSQMKKAGDFLTFSFQKGGYFVKNKEEALEEFTNELNRGFLSPQELPNLPVLEFEEKPKDFIHLANRGGTSSYVTPDVSEVFYPEKYITFPEDEVNIRFVIPPKIIRRTFEAKDKMKLKDLTITKDGFLMHNRGYVPNSVIIEHPHLLHNGRTDAFFKIENLKLIPLYYEVEIAEGIARFTSRNENYKLVYYISVDSDEDEKEEIQNHFLGRFFILPDCFVSVIGYLCSPVSLMLL